MRVKQIDSTSNQTVKEIRKLNHRKERFAKQQFLIEGIRIVGDALQHGAGIDMLIYSPDLLKSVFAKNLLLEFGESIPQVLECSEAAFRSIAKKENPQGLAAVATMEYQEIKDIQLMDSDIWVVLDTIRDPGNLGTILRTLDGIGGTGVILLDDCVDAYDPTAIRASMGAIFSQKVVKSTFIEFRDWISKLNLQVVGTSDHEGRKHYREAIYQKPTLLMMGSERAGLPDSHLEICDEMVFIPMFGSCDSLNLSVATGVILYEIAYQLKEVRT